MIRDEKEDGSVDDCMLATELNYYKCLYIQSSTFRMDVFEIDGWTDMKISSSFPSCLLLFVARSREREGAKESGYLENQSTETSSFHASTCTYGNFLRPYTRAL